MTPKVLQVVEPGKDGVFRHVEGLVRYLLNVGYSVSLAYSSVRSSDQLPLLLRKVHAAGGQLIDLKVGNSPGLSDLQAAFRLVRLARRTRFDVIHAHSSKAGALTRLLPLAGIRSPIFYTPNAYFGMGEHKWSRRFFFNSLERVFGKVGTTINVSNDEARFAAEVLRIRAQRQLIIPNGVDVSMFVPSDRDTRETRKVTFNLPKDSLVLGTVGRFSRQKDPLTLYQAIIRVMLTNPRLVFFHVGEGDLVKEAEAMVRVAGLEHRFFRREYIREPYGFYQALDGFILASRYEGLSVAVLEALSCDIPLILSNAPGNRDFSALGLSHLWSAQVGSVNGFVDAIQEWVRSSGVCKRCNHRKVAVENFSVERCYNRVRAAYDLAIDSHPTF